MKKIEAIIRPYKIDEVKEALLEIGVLGMTITEVKGFGRQKGHDEVYRGSEYIENFLPKIKLEVYTTTEESKRIIKVIKDAAKTGKIGDGKIFVSPLDHAERIRTGESGEDAL